MFVCRQCFPNIYIWLLVENWFVSLARRGVEVCLQAPAAMLGEMCYCTLTELPLLSELNLCISLCVQGHFGFTVRMGMLELP